MKPGRDLDILIAEEVMGYTYSKTHRAWTRPELGIDHECPPFSTDIAAAWEVVKSLEEQGWGLVLERRAPSFSEDSANRLWVAYFNKHKIQEHQGIDHEAPLAICKAALKIFDSK